MSAPAYELAQYLDAQGVGTFAGSSSWALAVGTEPVSPDDVVTLYDTGGSAAVVVDDDLRAPSVQVRTRSHSYLDAYDKQQEVRDILAAIIDQTISDHDYIGVWMTSDIIDIGKDENSRFRLTANYEVNRSPTGG